MIFSMASQYLYTIIIVKNFKCKAILNNLSQISNQIQNKTISNSLKLEQIC